MTDRESRERLVELIKQAKKQAKNANCDIERNMIFADHLIANGVIVTPCKVGQTVYELICDDPFCDELNFDNYVVEPSTVKDFAIFTTKDIHCMNGVGKTVFLTKEEAEQKLKELQNAETKKP